MKKRALLLALTSLVSSSYADAVKDREGAVRQDRAAMENDKRWIYNDFEKGFAEAKKTGKPLLVVLRCVPCLACMGIDTSVLTDAALMPLLDQFVCVRVMNANALDLSLFQVDYDLSFSTTFFNGDGTVYGRYGSWTHQKNSQDTTITGYRKALEAVLAIHKGYPGNKASLAGKQGMALPFKSPLELPTLADKYKPELDWNAKVVGSCVHCHMIGDAFRTWYRDKKQPIPAEWIYPWPSPDTIGFNLVPDSIAKVESVTAGSSAASAGLKVGDELVSLAGQPLASIADVSWILHRAADPSSLEAVVKRDGKELPVTLALPAGWRMKSDSSKRVGAWAMRGMVSGGMVVEDLSNEDRQQRSLTNDQLALLVKSVGQYGKHAAAKKAGFQKDDLIVEIDGLTKRTTESELFGHLLTLRMPGEQVKTVVLRGDKRVELMLPMQ